MTNYGITSEGFNRKSYEKLLEEAIDRAREIFGDNIDMSESSPLFKLVEVLTVESSSVWSQMSELYNSMFSSTASGQQLDTKGLDYGIERKDAVKTTGYALFAVSEDTTIPYSTRVQTADDTPIVFQTYESGVATGGAEVFVGIEAIIPGESGNVERDTITVLTDSITGVTSVNNPIELFNYDYFAGDTTTYQFTLTKDNVTEETIITPTGTKCPVPEVYYPTGSDGMGGTGATRREIIYSGVPTGNQVRIDKYYGNIIFPSGSGEPPASGTNNVYTTYWFDNTFDSGDEEESDSELRRRIIGRPKTWWTSTSMRAELEKIEGVSRISISEVEDEPQFDIYVLPEVPPLSDYLESLLTETADEIRPLCIQLRNIVEPTYVTINVSSVVETTYGFDISDVQDSVEENIEEYISELILGDDVQYYEIVSTINNTVGVEDIVSVTVNSGTSNITVDEDEMAVLGTVEVTE